jgi:hypothetical protein
MLRVIIGSAYITILIMILIVLPSNNNGDGGKVLKSDNTCNTKNDDSDLCLAALLRAVLRLVAGPVLLLLRHAHHVLKS